MIKLFTAPSCLGCGKVKKYFKDHNIKFEEKSIINHKLKREDIYKMLVHSENGFEDIISTRSKVFQEHQSRIEDMQLSELVDFIIENPTVLKRPIILNDYELQVGYNVDDITIFLPEEYREQECLFCVPEEECEYRKHLEIID
jgi:regulatory protein spx